MGRWAEGWKGEKEQGRKGVRAVLQGQEEKKGYIYIIGLISVK